LHGASELIAPDERIEPKVLRLYKKIKGERFDNMGSGLEL